MKRTPIELQRNGEDGPVEYLFSANDTNLGYATGYICQSISDVHISDLEIREPFRGRKIGSCCLRLIELDGSRLGLRTVSASSYFHTRPFYARNGFRTAREDFLDVLMRKRIDPAKTETLLERAEPSIL